MIRWGRVLAHAVVAGTLTVAVFGTVARGQEDPGALKVFGYITSAQATPITFEYNQPSFGVPATPTFEMRFLHSEAHADSGPSARALSSVAWPGDLAGNAPPSLLVETFVPPDLIEDFPYEDQAWTAFRDGLMEGLEEAPPYPIRSESFYPQGGEDERDVAAGIRMSSSASERAAEASTTGNKTGFPDMFSAGHINSSVFSGIRDGIAVTEARAEIQDLDLFDGVIRLGSFRSTRIASSDGEDGKLAGSVDISGLEIAGTRVFGVKSDGPTFGDETIPWNQAMQAIGQLAEHGITVRLIEADEETDGARARSRVSGIEIEMNSFAMGRFVDSFPEPIRDLIRDPGSNELLGQIWGELPPDVTGFGNAITAFDHSITIRIGDVRVNGIASPPFSFEMPPPPVFEPPPPAPFDPVVTLPEQPAPVAPGPVQQPTNGGTFAPVITPVATTGVPASAAVFVFFLAAAAAGGLRALADRATAPGAASITRCTLEG